jgi:hypothetical protein
MNNNNKKAVNEFWNLNMYIFYKNITFVDQKIMDF